MKDNSSQPQGQNQRGPRNHSRGGRRSGNSRGPRRDNEGSDQNERSRERSNYGTRESRPAKPLSLWQKIVALLTGKSSTKTAPVASAPSRHPTERAAEARAARPSDSYRRVEQRPDRPDRDVSDSAPAATGENRDRRETRPPREPRVMEKIEVTSPRLYVGNLSFDAVESDLSDLFNGVGKVKNAEVVSNNYTQKSKGFAFVTMETIDEAKRAVVELHDKEFMGRKLLVSGAKPSERES